MPPEDLSSAKSRLPDGELLLAVDAGGTKTVACLAIVTDDDEPKILGEGRSSAGNPLSVGFEMATEAIQQAVDAARQASAVGRRPVHAVLSIAGAGNRELAGRFTVWGKANALADRVTLVTDVLAILAAGSQEPCGLALISGTGSSAFALGATGRAARRGGWGFLLGDEGSGYALGRAALRLALEALELNSGSSTAPSNDLGQQVIASLQVKTVSELTRNIYGSPNPRQAIAALAPLVAAAAENEDLAARRIVGTAAADLARLAERAACAAGLEKTTFQLALGGSVLVNSACLREELLREIAALKLHCEPHVVANPLLGCLRLANRKYERMLMDWNE